MNGLTFLPPEHDEVAVRFLALRNELLPCGAVVLWCCEKIKLRLKQEAVHKCQGSRFHPLGADACHAILTLTRSGIVPGPPVHNTK